MQSSQNNRVMAFAAICQAAEMVKDIARHDRVDERELSTMLNSLLKVNAPSAVDIYGDLTQLNLGYRTLLSQLGNSKQKDMEVTRYMLGAIILERQLVSQPKAMQLLGQRLEQLQLLVEQESITTDHSVEAMADIYTDVISPLGRRIQVAGDPQYLKQLGNQHKVRALLLAGIRAAVLWRQVGGKRRQLIFSRGAILANAEQVLRQY